MFKKAVKYQAKGRVSLSGPAGAGKTMTALKFATFLADGSPIAVIDTERGSASKYADLFEFDVLELDNYHPDKFIQAIHDAEQAGYAVLVIDSLSHAWNGPGGILEIVDNLKKRSTSKNAFTEGWSQATPIQNKLIDAITRSSLHIIATMRSKTEYVMESNGSKTTPRKVGTTPIQRDGLEYEFDICADMDVENNLIIQKSRCSELSGKVYAKPGADVASIIKQWLDGTPESERTYTLAEVFKVGMQRESWIAATFYETATRVLGATVEKNSTLTPEQSRQLMEAARRGPVEAAQS